jgi:hypothetical protein
LVGGGAGFGIGRPAPPTGSFAFDALSIFMPVSTDAGAAAGGAAIAGLPVSVAAFSPFAHEDASRINSMQQRAVRILIG